MQFNQMKRRRGRASIPGIEIASALVTRRLEVLLRLLLIPAQ